MSESISPRSETDALILSGNQLEDGGDPAGALACYLRAVGGDPASQRAWLNVGNAHLLLKDLDAAQRAFEAALAIGAFAPAHLNLGNLYAQTGAPLAAIEQYRKALEVRPHWDQAQLGLCLVLMQTRHPDALAQIRTLVQDHPRLLKGRVMLAEVLSDTAPREALRLLEGLPEQPPVLAGRARCRAKLLDHAGACADYARALELEPGNHDYAGSLAFSSLNDETQSPERLLSALSRHAQVRWPAGWTQLLRQPGTRIRVGYISGDFIANPLMNYAVTLFKAHDRRQFEVVAISATTRPDAVTQLLRSHVDEWLDISKLSDREACALIKARQVDILIDLSGHSSANRLGVLALRAAPVQMTALGVLSSTYTPNVDYRIADAWTDPVGRTETWHSERILRMPGFHACYSQLRAIAFTPELPALRSGVLTFGYFNNAMKLGHQLLGDFGQILKSIPDSRLLVLGVHNPEIAEIIRARLHGDCGIALQRLDIRGRLDLAAFSSLMTTVDIALDAFPYSGGITTIETLLAGVPVLSIAGERPSSRNGLAILSNLGLGDWVVDSHPAFVAAAVSRAARLPELQVLRSALPARMRQSVIMDASRFIRDWEDLLRGVLPPS